MSRVQLSKIFAVLILVVGAMTIPIWTVTGIAQPHVSHLVGELWSWTTWTLLAIRLAVASGAAVAVWLEQDED